MLRLLQNCSLLSIGALSLIACCAVSPSKAQNQPGVLERSAHCLVTAWLSPEDIKGDVLTASYTQAAKGSNEFGHAIYLVIYLSSDRTQGYIFDIGYKKQDGRWVLLLQNNAKFIRSGKDVSFIDPPLGGTWTQEHLIKGIERIATQPTVSFRVQNLLKPDSTDCKSYADPDRQIASGKGAR
jgi:hypothetical protein